MTDSDRFVSYPLSDRFTLRAGAGRPSRRVRGLAGASDWRREALDRVGSVLVATAGTRRLSPVRAWSWPACEPVDLVEALQDHLPGLSILAAAAPRQSGRARLSVLAEWRHHDIVVKLGRPDDGIDTEAEVLRLLSDDPLPGIATPRVLAAGELSLAGRTAFLATSALAVRQRPAIDEPLRTFETDLATRLASLRKPPGTPDGAIPTHGDLTPWNLRRTGRGLALFDWESAGWRTSGSDLAQYRRTSAELRARRRRRVS